MAGNCKHCGKPLKDAQFRNGKEYKSCPKCSQAGGGEHIFYHCPLHFGTTQLRATANHPEGWQSYCEPCRGSSTGPYAGAKKCSEM